MFLKLLKEDTICFCARKREGRPGAFTDSVLEEEHAQLKVPIANKPPGPDASHAN